MEVPTTKEIKKKHSSRPVGGAEMEETGRQGGEDSRQHGWRIREVVECGTNGAGSGTASKANIRKLRNKEKESPKMGRQKKTCNQKEQNMPH